MLPGKGASLTPPTYKSMSSTLSLYAIRSRSLCVAFMFVRSSMDAARTRPHIPLNWLYGGKPWSRPRWMFMAARSPTIPSNVEPFIKRFSRTAGAKNLKGINVLNITTPYSDFVSCLLASSSFLVHWHHRSHRLPWVPLGSFDCHPVILWTLLFLGFEVF